MRKVMIAAVVAVLCTPNGVYGRGLSRALIDLGEHEVARERLTFDRTRQATTSVLLEGVRATVAFSPHGGGQNLIVGAIDDARRQILVQAYGFSNRAILGALVRAKRRGVDVRVLLDKSNETERYSGATYMVNNAVPTYIDDTVRIAHNKVMIIDGVNVITGSFNFTRSAQTRNAENVLYLQGAPRLAAAYVKDWRWRRSLSHPYRPSP